MESLKQMLNSIDLDNLLKIFDIQIALAVLLFFIVFRTVFSRVLIKIYYKLTKCKRNPKESQMYKPLNLFFVLLGIYCMINILPTSENVLSIMNDIFKVVVLYYVTKAISTLINEDSILFKKIIKKSKNKAVDRFICRILKIFLWMIAIVISLNYLGFKLDGFGALVTGLGISSAALALAAQDMVKSIISGFAILTDKPFIVGDWIEVGQYQGTVVDITFRSVRIKAYNNTVVTIPNSIITSDYVVNWNRLNSRRFDCILNLHLDTQTEKIRKIIKEIKLTLQNNPDVIKETIQVHLDAISAYSADIKIFLYVNVAEYVEFLRIKEDILCSLLFLAEKENIELAYPSQTLYVQGKENIEG